jgi:hypothetical protein
MKNCSLIRLYSLELWKNVNLFKLNVEKLEKGEEV